MTTYRRGEYRQRQGEAGRRYALNAEGLPRPKYSREDIARRMAQVPTVIAVMRGQVLSDKAPESTLLSDTAQNDSDPTSWRDEAACRGEATDIFFPDESNAPAFELARMICRPCTVRSDCLRYALSTGQERGMWGGMDERERRKLRKIQ